MPVLNWMRDHPMVPIFAVTLYCVLIFGGQHLMRNKPAWNWRRSMAVWNLSLSLFSWFGMFRTLPQLMHNLYYMSVRDNLCLDPRVTYGSGSSGLWVQLFILSKFPWVDADCCCFENELTFSDPEFISFLILFSVNSLILSSLSFTRNLLFSFTGITTLLSCFIAGILMWQHPLQEFSLWSWTTVSMQPCTATTFWWPWSSVLSGSIQLSLLAFRFLRWSWVSPLLLQDSTITPKIKAAWLKRKTTLLHSSCMEAISVCSCNFLLGAITSPK